MFRYYLISLLLVLNCFGQLAADEPLPAPNPEAETNDCDGELAPLFQSAPVGFYKGAPLWELPPSTTFNAFGEPRIVPSNFFVDEALVGYQYGENRLPPSADPNDLQGSALHGPLQLGIARQSRLLLWATNSAGSGVDTSSPTTGLQLQLRPGVFYDTGAFADASGNFVSPAQTFDPGHIALNGTPAAQHRGEVTFYQLDKTLQPVGARIQSDLQWTHLLGIDQVQTYVDAVHLNDNTLSVRGLFAHAATDNHGVVVGKAETAFGDLGSIPSLIAGGALPVGAIAVTQSDGQQFTGISQLRYTRLWGSHWESTVSLEDQDPEQFKDVKFPAASVVLHHWPALAGRVRYKGATKFDTYQIASLVRPIGFNDTNFQDHVLTGWGISGIARFANLAQTNAIYAGVVGGRGIGAYIFGNISGAEFTSPADFHTLSNFGSYGALQHVWLRKDAVRNLTSNLAYGYVLSETASPTDNRELHQAWGNLIWNASPTSSFGVEYQYGRRRIGDGNHGEDHRVMFVFQLTGSPPKLANPLSSSRDANQDRTSDFGSRRL